MASKYNINKRKQFLDLYKNDNLEYVVDLTTFKIYVGNTANTITSKDGVKVGNILTHASEYPFFVKMIDYARTHNLVYGWAVHRKSYSKIWEDIVTPEENVFQQVNEMFYVQNILTDDDDPLNYDNCVMIANNIKTVRKFMKETGCDIKKFCYFANRIIGFAENPFMYDKLISFADEITTPNFLAEWYNGYYDLMKRLYTYRKWFRQIRNNFPLLSVKEVWDYKADYRKRRYVDNVVGLLDTYLEYVEALKIEPAPIHSYEHLAILVDDIIALYEAKKDEILSAELKKVADKHKDKFNIEDDELFVTIPSCVEDFKKEANYQQNCLYRFGYMDNVVKGTDLIIFIRKKNDPNTPYITCEINYRNGHNYINQYYGRYNCSMVDDKSLAFRRKLEKLIGSLSLF